MADCYTVDEIRDALRVLLNAPKVHAALAHAPMCESCCDQESAPELVMAAYLVTKALELSQDMVIRYSTEP